MCVENKCQHFKSTRTILWDTDDDKISPDGSDSSFSVCMVSYLLLIFHAVVILLAITCDFVDL
jgi:hypothetical protein